MWSAELHPALRVGLEETRPAVMGRRAQALRTQSPGLQGSAASQRRLHRRLTFLRVRIGGPGVAWVPEQVDSAVNT